MHFIRCRQGQFVYQSRSSKVGDHFLYYRDLKVQFRDDTVRTNEMLVTLRCQEDKEKGKKN